MALDKPIMIQKIDQETETWSDWRRLHAEVNADKSTEYVEAGADLSKSTKTFKVRYFAGLEDVDFNLGLYRIVYGGHYFNVTGYDDYMERHITVIIRGESYGD